MPQHPSNSPTEQSPLHAHLEAVVAETLESHLNCSCQALAGAVAAAVIRSLHLSAGNVFIDDNDPAAPTESFCPVSGRINVVA